MGRFAALSNEKFLNFKKIKKGKKMATYKMLGGGSITGATSEEIVIKLNETSLFGYSESIEQFMKSTAEACKLQTGAIIRTSSTDEFVEDLLNNGFLKKQ